MGVEIVLENEGGGKVVVGAGADRFFGMSKTVFGLAGRKGFVVESNGEVEARLE